MVRARSLEQRRATEASAVAALRAQLDAGIAALERGDYVEIDAASLDAYLDELTMPKRRSIQRKRNP